MWTSSFPVYNELEVRSASFRPPISGSAPEIQLSAFGLARIAHKSKLELGFELNHSRCIVPSVAAQNAGRWRRQVGYLAEGQTLDLIIGEPKIWVIEEIEELEANPKCGPFPTG